MKKGEQIGIGGNKQVFRDSHDDKKVVLEFHKKVDNEQIRGTFYLSKIAHLLFPDNIPNIDIAGNRTKSYLHMTREDHDPAHSQLNALLLKERDYITRISDEPKLTSAEQAMALGEMFEKEFDPYVRAFCDKAIESGLIIDQLGKNFSHRSGEPVKYLDVQLAWIYGWNKEIKLNFDEALLVKSIKRLDEPQRTLAGVCLQRLLELVSQKKLELVGLARQKEQK